MRTFIRSRGKAEKDVAHLEVVYTNPEFRGHGVARRLLQETVNAIKKRWPHVKHIDGDYLSQKALHLANDLLGKPEYLGDVYNEFTDDPDRAMKMIEPDAEERMGGLEGPRVDARHKLPTRIPKKKLQPLKPWDSQLELFPPEKAREQQATPKR
jgi:hypothetical protein